MKYQSNDDSLQDGQIGLFVDNLDHEKCPNNLGSNEMEDDPFMKAARTMMTIAMIAAFCAICMLFFEFLLCRICCAVVLQNLAFVAASLLGGLAYLSFGSEYCTTDGEGYKTILENLPSQAASVYKGSQDLEDLYNCSFGRGCKYNLCAMVIYLGASVVLCCTPKPKPLIASIPK